MLGCLGFGRGKQEGSDGHGEDWYRMMYFKTSMGKAQIKWLKWGKYNNLQKLI